MIKDAILTGTVAIVTFVLTRWFSRKERKIDLQKKMLSMYEELSSKHLELQAKYNDLAAKNIEMSEKLSSLACELDNLKKENHKLKIKIMLMQSKEEPCNENNTPLA